MDRVDTRCFCIADAWLTTGFLRLFLPAFYWSFPLVYWFSSGFIGFYQILVGFSRVTLLSSLLLFLTVCYRIFTRVLLECTWLLSGFVLFIPSFTWGTEEFLRPSVGFPEFLPVSSGVKRPAEWPLSVLRNQSRLHLSRGFIWSHAHVTGRGIIDNGLVEWSSTGQPFGFF